MNVVLVSLFFAFGGVRDGGGLGWDGGLDGWGFEILGCGDFEMIVGENGKNEDFQLTDIQIAASAQRTAAKR